MPGERRGKAGYARVGLVLLSKAVVVTAAEIASVAEAVLAGEKQPMRVGIVVVGDAASRRVNRDFLGHDYATDVIAFDLRDGGPGRTSEDDPDGEILVNAAQARREAAARGHPARSELLFYVAHGLLHLCGYDDSTSADRARMHARQAYYLSRLGIVVRS